MKAGPDGALPQRRGGCRCFWPEEGRAVATEGPEATRPTRHGTDEGKTGPEQGAARGGPASLKGSGADDRVHRPKPHGHLRKAK